MNVNMNVNNKKQVLRVRNGHVWEKSALHLKSAIPGFNHKNIVDQIELDLFKALIKS